MPAVNKSERNCKPTRRDPEQKLLLLCVGHGRFCHSFLLVQTSCADSRAAAQPRDAQSPALPAPPAPWLNGRDSEKCAHAAAPLGRDKWLSLRKKGEKWDFFVTLIWLKEKKKQNSSFEFLGRQGKPSCTVQPQIIAAFGLINSRTPLLFIFLAPQTADGFVICLNNYCNKEANSVGWRIFFHNVFACIVYTIYFTICSIIRGLDNHLVVSAT